MDENGKQREMKFKMVGIVNNIHTIFKRQGKKGFKGFQKGLILRDKEKASHCREVIWTDLVANLRNKALIE